MPTTTIVTTTSNNINQNTVKMLEMPSRVGAFFEYYNANRIDCFPLDILENLINEQLGLELIKAKINTFNIIQKVEFFTRLFNGQKKQADLIKIIDRFKLDYDTLLNIVQYRNNPNVMLRRHKYTLLERIILNFMHKEAIAVDKHIHLLSELKLMLASIGCDAKVADIAGRIEALKRKPQQPLNAVNEEAPSVPANNNITIPLSYDPNNRFFPAAPEDTTSSLVHIISTNA